ncbi:MAG TPA: ABC transporter permease [Caproiciproducens sp.]|nr:ABC transporter permease [Caproiciproducens sp.]
MMQNIFQKTVKTLALPLILYLVFLIAAPARFSSANCFTTILYQSFIPSIIGYGMSFGFICGIFDFTIGSRVVIAEIIGGMLSVQYGLAGLIIGCLVAGIAVGALTGFVNWIARIPSLVVSFGLAMVFEIVGQWMSGKSSMVTLKPSMSILWSFPYNIIVMVVCFALFYLIFYRTRFSYHTNAVGNDELIAKSMGVNVPKIKFLTFLVSGIFLGVVSVLQISYTGSAGSQINLTSVMALFRPMMGVIVGLALQSVCNIAVGIFVGEFSINVIFVGLIALGLPDTLQNVMLGIFLLIVMVFSSAGINLKQLLSRKKPVAMNS